MTLQRLEGGRTAQPPPNKPLELISSHGGATDLRYNERGFSRFESGSKSPLAAQRRIRWAARIRKGSRNSRRS